VGAALELEDGVGAVAADVDGVGPFGGVERLRREAQPLGVAGEHAVEVAGPDRGLVAACARADLDDDVLVVVGVALDHRQAQLLLEALDPLPRRPQLLAHLGILPLVEELLGALGVRHARRHSSASLAAGASCW
jgi:hypothetical protein